MKKRRLSEWVVLRHAPTRCMALRTGISAHRLHRIVLGRATATLDEQLAICSVLGVLPEHVLEFAAQQEDDR